MSNQFYTKSNEGTSFREIVLQHLKKILELSSKEFRGGYMDKIYEGNSVREIYVPNSRAEYIQAIESLHDILLPYFDDRMKKASEKYGVEIGKEFKRTKDKAKEYKSSNKSYSWKNLWSSEKIKHTRKLFQELNLLLNRSKYLKSEIYEE